MNLKLSLQREGKKISRKKDILLITGDGKSLLKDLERFFFYNHHKHDVMGIGRSLQAYPGIVQHYVDVDSDAGKWVAETLECIYPDKINGALIKHTLGGSDDAPWFDNTWDLADDPFPHAKDMMWHGSSGLFALLVGLEMGYKRIVLAGCPMDSKGHWYFPGIEYGPVWTFESYQAWFEFTLDPRKRRVRSCSGYTEILLGAPDEDFFNGIS